MNYFQRGVLGTHYIHTLVIGYVLVSLGMLLSAGGGTWDVSNHLLNKPETFFAPPHALLYSGVASALVGAIIVVAASRAARKMNWPAKMVLAGTVVLLSAGPVDFVWHSNFGLDGLLSPPHSVLIGGMVASSAGAMAGIVYAYQQNERKALPPVLIVICMLPVWLSAAGVVHMFSLPFSHTGFFDFNPEPHAGAALATLAFPFITAAILLAASILSERKFGVMTALSAAFIFASTLSSIVPNESLAPTIPFYIATIIPIAAADAILSGWRSHISLFIAGALIGVTFLMLYYPLITHTYNKVTLGKTVWASLTAPIYFEMLGIVFPLIAVPAASAGIVGAIVGERIVRRAELALLK